MTDDLEQEVRRIRTEMETEFRAKAELMVKAQMEEQDRIREKLQKLQADDHQYIQEMAELHDRQKIEQQNLHEQNKMLEKAKLEQLKLRQTLREAEWAKNLRGAQDAVKSQVGDINETLDKLKQTYEQAMKNVKPVSPELAEFLEKQDEIKKSLEAKKVSSKTITTRSRPRKEPQRKKELTPLEQMWKRAWMERRNKAAHLPNAPKHFYTTFGVLSNVDIYASSIVITNHLGHRLTMRKNRMFADVHNDEAKKTTWSVLSRKAKSLLGQRVAVSLDLTTFKPAFFTDITGSEGLPSLAPPFHPNAGSDVFIDELRQAVEEGRKKLPRELMDELNVEVGSDRAGAVLEGKAWTIDELRQRIEKLKLRHDANKKQRKDIEEKLDIEIQHMEMAQRTARNNMSIAETQVEKHRKEFAEAEKMASELQAEKKSALEKNTEEGVRLSKRYFELEQVLKQAEQFTKDTSRQSDEVAVTEEDPTVVHMLTKFDGVKEKNRRRREGEAQGSNAEFTPAQIAQITAIIQATQQPVQSEDTVSRADYEALQAKYRASERQRNQDKIDRAREKRLLQTEQEKQQIAADYQAHVQANADTSDAEYKRAVEILEREYGTDLYKGSKRVQINSEKNTKTLAIATGINTPVRGALNVVFDRPYYAHDDQEDTNAYYCDLPDFGVTCIIAIKFKTGSTKDMVAATIFNDTAGWEKMQKKVVKKKFGFQGINRTDVSIEQWADTHFEIKDRLELEALEGDN